MKEIIRNESYEIHDGRHPTLKCIKKMCNLSNMRQILTKHHMSNICPANPRWPPLTGSRPELFQMNFEDISWNKFFKMSSSKQLTGHSLKLYKPSFRLDIRKYSFSQRVINEWNLLPDELMECTTVNNFKKRLITFAKTGDSNKQTCFFPRLLRSSGWRRLQVQVQI